MTTLAIKNKSPRRFLWALSDIGITWAAVMTGLEFHYQYLHNPVVHMFFQSQGVFLF